MSGVDFLNKLLEGVAMEWRPLGSLAEIYGGLTGKNKADFDGGNAKYVSYKNIFANINVDLSSLESVKVSSSENQHQVKYGDVLFTGSSEIADEAGMFVDKNLRYHGLMQAYSRTNRIYDATKTFGNIVTFRDLEQATIDAITLFGDKNTKNVVLEKSYKEYMEGFTDVVTGEARRGFVEVVKELEQRFPDPSAIEKESDKKAFAKLFGEYLRIEHVLQNYDEFAGLKALQNIDMSDSVAVEAFKAKHYLGDEDLAALQSVKIPADRKIQDYRSAYNDIRDWLRREKSGKEQEESNIDWDDVVFEVDLLKSQEINLDFILELIFDNNKKVKDKVALVEDVRRLIRSSLGNRAKESLLVDFINQSDLDKMGDKAGVIEAFFAFAQAEQQREAQELISSESLNAEAAKRYITNSLKREYASDNGTELNAILPKMSPLNPQYLTKKQSVFQKIAAFVEKFKGVGGQV